MFEIMTAPVFINLGLAGAWPVGAPEDRNYQRKVGAIVLRTLGHAKARIVDVAQSDSEPTMVIACDEDVSVSRIYRLAELLDQDCIAYYNALHDFGILIGPRHKEWGGFDKAKFILPSGQ